MTAVTTIIEACRRRGVDLSAITKAGSYNSVVEAPFRLPGPDEATVLVLGNTRALWPHVERFVLDSPVPVADPVDVYVADVVHRAVEDAGVRPIDVRFDCEPPERRIAIQRLADVAGLAWLSTSHLCVHPEHGPWIALRAAVVLDPAVFDAAGRTPAATGPATAPCRCAANCVPVLERALAAGEPTNQAELRDRWRLWLAVRDACPVGRASRYTDEQIAYHYRGTRPDRWPPLSG